jgi:hypothetical protein
LKGCVWGLKVELFSQSIPQTSFFCFFDTTQYSTLKKHHST